MGLFSKLTGRTNGGTKKLPRTTPATATRIKNILGIRELESMPLQAARAFQLASDPKSNAADFIKVIEKDEALSAKVVRVANSVYFSRGTKATDIEKAVANIGIDELRCLLTASMLKSLLAGKHELRKQLWANAVATAIASRNIARLVQGISPSEAFFSGLVHDVGKLVMIRKHGHSYQQVVSIAGSGEHTFIEAEEEVFDTNHVEIGKWVAESWSFPDSAIRAIATHHDPWPKTMRKQGETPQIGFIVKAADLMAHAVAIGHPSTGCRGLAKRAEEELDSAFSYLGISLENQKAFLDNLLRQFDEESAMFEVES